MNKKQAKKCVYENESITYGDLLRMLEGVDMFAPSKVNPRLPKQMVVKIMRARFDGKKPNDIVITTRLNTRDKITLTPDGINMMNILMECS